MALLTNITGQLYGLTQDFDLAPVTVVLGPNESGKSILLSVPNRLLTQPSRGDADWNLSGAWTNAVHMSGATGKTNAERMTVARRVEPHEVRIDGTATPVKQADTIIAAGLGRAWDWSASDFIELSGDKRTAEVRRHIRFDWTVGEVMQELRSELGARETELAITWAEELDDRYTNPECPDGQQFLGALVEQLQAKWRACNAELVEVRGAVATSSQDLADSCLPGGTSAAVQVEVDDANTRLQDLHRELGKHEGASEAMAALVTATREAREALGRAQMGLETQNVVINKARNNLETAQERFKRDTIQLCVSQDKLTEHREQVASWESQVAAADAAARGTREADVIGQAFAADQQLLFMVSWIAHAEEGSDVPSGMIAHATAMIQRWEYRIPNHVKVTDGVLKTAVAQLSAARRLADAVEIPPPPTDLSADWAARLEREETVLASMEEKIPQLAAKVEELQVQLIEMKRGDFALIQQQVIIVEAQRSAAQARLAKLQDAEGIRQQGIKLAGREFGLIELRDQVREVGRKVRSVEGTLLNRATSELLALGNRITSDVLDATMRLELVKGRTRLMLGRRTLESCSRSVQALVLTALQTAVMATLPGWRIAIIDDLEAFEAIRRTDLVESLVRLVQEGHLDQVLVAAVTDDWAWPRTQAHPESLVRVIELQR